MQRRKLEIRVRDRAPELYAMLRDILANDKVCAAMPEDLLFAAGRLLSRIERYTEAEDEQHDDVTR